MPTRFVTDGKALNQVVDFDARTAFPVTADPNWWQGALTAAAGVAVGAAAIVAIPQPGPTVGSIVGGWVTFGLNEMIDNGLDWYEVAFGCIKGSAIGAFVGAIGSIMRTAIIPWLQKLGR